jgi:ATP-dependent RNA helicase RhlE
MRTDSLTQTSTPAFTDLGLDARLLETLSREGYTTPTAVQAQSIPPLLDGRDLLAVAQTGTGKTAAFALPLLQRLAASGQRAEPGRARALVLVPTRELALQVETAVRTYGRGMKLRSAVVMGGASKGQQARALSRGLDLLIATPGRLVDHLNDGNVRLDRVEALVLDEADRMLDMGFLPAVRRIAGLVPAQRQSILVSATMAKEISRLAGDLLREPARVEVSPQSPAVDRIEQRVYHVAQPDKRQLLADLLQDPDLERVIVFTRTKHGADRLARQLGAEGIEAEAMHGNKTQGARQTALKRFAGGRARVLVATDVAARGLDVDGITHVVNYDLPNEAESYVHRIGRTGRAGASGIALSFCDAGERGQLRGIERLTRKSLTVVGDSPAEAPRPDRGPKGGKHAPGKPARSGPNGRARGHRGGGPRRNAA